MRQVAKEEVEIEVNINLDLDDLASLIFDRSIFLSSLEEALKKVSQ